MFSIIDAIFIIIILIFAIVGYFRGFLGSIIKSFGRIIKFYVSFLLAKPFSKLVYSLTKINEHMFDKFNIKFLSISDKFAVDVSGMTSNDVMSLGSDALADAKIPKIFRGLLLNILKVDQEYPSSTTLADIFADHITNIIIVVSSFVIIYLLLMFLFIILNRISKRMLKSNSFVSTTNRYLGVGFGTVKAVAIIGVLFIAVSLLDKLGWISKIVIKIDDSLIVGPVYRFFKGLISKYLNL